MRGAEHVKLFDLSPEVEVLGPRFENPRGLSGFFRGTPRKSETTFFNQLSILFHRCRLRFYWRGAKDHAERSTASPSIIYFLGCETSIFQPEFDSPEWQGFRLRGCLVAVRGAHGAHRAHRWMLRLTCTQSSACPPCVCQVSQICAGATPGAFWAVGWVRSFPRPGVPSKHAVPRAVQACQVVVRGADRARRPGRAHDGMLRRMRRKRNPLDPAAGLCLGS